MLMMWFSTHSVCHWWGGAALVLACAGSARAGGGVSVWAKPVDGVWAEPSNWLNHIPPNSIVGAQLGLVGPYTVEISRMEDAAWLSITNPEAILDVRNGSYVRVFSDSFNDGLIRVHSDDSQFVRAFRARGEVTLSGQGTIELMHPLAKVLVEEGGLLTQGSGHTIRGKGIIQGSVRNQGRIVADDPAGLLFTDKFTNEGILEAVDTGMITLQQRTDQSASGVTRAEGAGAMVVLQDGVAISGGRVESMNGGVFELGQNAGFVGVTIDSQLIVQPSLNSSMTGSQLHNASLVIQENGSFRFSGTNTLDGEGSIAIEGDPTSVFVTLDRDFLLSKGYTLRGSGRVSMSGAVIRGRIIADVPGETLRILGGGVYGGEISATNGATLEISGELESDGGFLASSGAGSQLLLNNLNMTGKVNSLRSLDGGEIINTGFLQLHGTLLLGPLYSEPGSSILCTGSIYNNGEIVLNDATMQMQNFNQLFGPGSVRLIGPEAGLYDVSIGYDQAIEGEGTVGGTSYNAGLIRADTPGKTLVVGNLMNNFNIIAVTDAGRMVIPNQLLQTEDGRIDVVGEGSQLVLGSDGTFSGARIQSGSINTTDGGRVIMGRSYELRGVEINGDIVGDDLYILKLTSGSTLNGSIDFMPSGDSGGIVNINSPAELNGEGRIVMSTNNGTLARVMGGSVADPLDLGPGIEITGPGNILGNTIINGTISPGQGIGRIHCLSPVTLSQTSRYNAEVGPDGSDLITSSQQFALHGQLRVTFVDGFNPLGYWSRTVIEATEINTDGLVLELPKPVGGLVSRSYNTGIQLLIGQAPLSDMNLDGETNFFDVGIFINYVLAEDPRADLDGNGVVNFFDISLFLQGLI